MDTRTRAAPLAPLRVPHRAFRPAPGPFVIAASVLVAMRATAFAGRLTAQHPDLLASWLPRTCLLARGLRAGRIPLWNPHELLGTPLVADPQSGWLSVLWTAAPTFLGCPAGLAAIVVLQPILAGLGLRWFLRREGLAEWPATAGGLSLAMLVASSRLAVSLPFAGTLAWTPYLLVAAAAFARGRGAGRLPWLALGALAWGQVATAHLSHGLAIATALGIAVLVASSRGRGGRGAAAAASFLAFLPIANVAILLPHLAFVARSSLGGGYDALPDVAAAPPLVAGGVWAGWPFALAAAPGAYAGATILLAALGAFRDRTRRSLVAALCVVGAGAYVLTLDALVGAAWFRRAVLAVPYGDVYLHNPGRLRLALFVVVAVLGAIGLGSLVERPPSRRAAAVWGVAGPALLLALPIAAGALPARFALAAAGAAAAIAVARATARRPAAAAPALVAVLAIELLLGAAWGTSYRGGAVPLGLEGSPRIPMPAPLRAPRVDPDTRLAAGPIARAMLAAAPTRYLAWIPPDVAAPRGYLPRQRPADLPALLLGRAALLGLRDVGGYSPLQMPRTWAYLRAGDPLPMAYNAAVLRSPTTATLRLLGVGWLVLPDGLPLPGDLSGTVVAREGGFALVRLDGAASPVAVVGRWRAAPDGDAALAAVRDPTFDAGEEAIVEGVAGGGFGGADAASIRVDDPERLAVAVTARGPALLVVRTAWDEGWSATVDGRASPVLRTDFLFQGVRVPAGRHVVELRYRDATVGRGAALSAIAWAGLGLAWVGARRRARRAPPRADAVPPR